MNIPLINLKAQYKQIQNALEAKVLEVLSNAQYIMGKEVFSFEQEFAQYIGVKHAISVGNGTDALVIALKSLGIGEGDEVITSPFTFFATAESISAVGATPVFVDVRPDTFNLDPNLIEDRITAKTKAIMPVHIFGQAVDMDQVNDIARRHGLFVIEDACQAVGGKYRGQMLGSLGNIACFSFFPTKNLGCAGDGGMIVTNDDDLAVICRGLRAHGSGENGRRAYNLLKGIDEVVEVDSSTDNTVYNPLKYFNYLIGHNSRLDEVQAAILRVKLPLLDTWNSSRRNHAAFYHNALEGMDLVRPVEAADNEHVYHMYVIQSEGRDALVAYLKERGIATGIYYPVPLHLQKAYLSLGYAEGDLPTAEYLSKRTFAIPMFPELTTDEREYIVKTLKAFD